MNVVSFSGGNKLQAPSFLLLLLLLLLPVLAIAQQPDSLEVRQLKDVNILGWKNQFQPVDTLPDVHNGFLMAGKSSHSISMEKSAASQPEKAVRQVFAKIPGAFAYDMDGSGNQVNLSLRGLDPHRSWDLNVRQNGIMLNSDIYGYPASHYNPPLEAIGSIELVRGTASLQYGAMFGGMMNYVVRRPDTTGLVSYRGQSAVGAWNTLSSYNEVGGKAGRITWQLYDYRRRSDGYRKGSNSWSQAQYGRVILEAAKGLTITGEVGRSTYLYQIPGPLTDAQFAENPTQATRTRNFYSPDITVPSLSVRWKITPQTELNWNISKITGDRSSVQFIGGPERRDTINLQTGLYAPRQVDIDLFNSATSELRVLHRWEPFGRKSFLSAGVRGIRNDLNRRQIGQGTTGSDYDLSLTLPGWGRDVHYQTDNIAVFAEHLTWLTPRLSVSPGIRVERGLTNMFGEVRNVPAEQVQTELSHRFTLLGISSTYRLSGQMSFFGGWSQAYRPVVLGEVLPTSPLERVDPALSNSYGTNTEIGLISKWAGGTLLLNITAFEVLYRNRIGMQAMEDANGSTYFLKTNIGDSRTRGLEIYGEWVMLRRREASLSLFTATAWMDGIYLNGSLLNAGQNVDLTGNRVESTPALTSRNGLQGTWKQWSGSVLFHAVSKTYSDPINTETPNANGSRGVVPAYQLVDAQVKWQPNELVALQLSLNNALDRSYFTKRPTIYPGPAVWPSDGRGWTLAVTFTP